MKKEMNAKTALLGIGVILCIIGITAWAYQIFAAGMVITDLRNIFSWGLYMGSFEFFIALSSGGMVLFSICYIWKINALKPFTKLAAIVSFASVVAAGIAIMEDLGYPMHIMHMLIHANLMSPLLWDVGILGIYAIICLVALILQLVPDLKKFRHRRAFRLDCELLSAKLSYVALPFVAILNAGTALMFATQSTREWWHSALIPVNAVAEGVAVGLGFMLLLAAILAGKEGFKVWNDGFRLLARIAGVAILAYLLMTVLEMITLGWNAGPASKHLIHLITRDYGLLFWLEILLPLIAMILYFALRQGSRRIYIFAGVLVIIGIFIQRMMLLLPAFNDIPLTLAVPGTKDHVWSFPIASGVFEEGEKLFTTFWNYTPTPLEWAVALLPVGIVILAIALGLKFFPLVPEAWEEQIVEDVK